MKFKIISVTRNMVDETKLDIEAIAVDKVGTYVNIDIDLIIAYQYSGLGCNVVTSNELEITRALTKRYNEMVALRDKESEITHALIGKEVEA